MILTIFNTQITIRNYNFVLTKHMLLKTYFILKYLKINNTFAYDLFKIIETKYKFINKEICKNYYY